MFSDTGVRNRPIPRVHGRPVSGRKLILTSLLALLVMAPAAHAAPRHGLLTGFSDFAAFQGPNPAERQSAFANLRAARGTVVRIQSGWNEIAPTKPPTDAAARDPAWPGYRWERLDTWVREAVAAHVTPLVLLTGAPAWAGAAAAAAARRRAPGSRRRPATACSRKPWRGATRAASRTCRACATTRPGTSRTSGTSSTPQWTRRGGRFRPASPAIYRKLLNAFYKGAKSGLPARLHGFRGHRPVRRVPAGREANAGRALHARAALCVRGRSHPRPKRRCPGGPVFFDALAHHPYPIGTPRRTAINPDDVVIPDIWKLTRPMKVALRAGYVRPRRPKPVLGDRDLLGHQPARPERPAGEAGRQVYGGRALHALAPGCERRGLVADARRAGGPGLGLHAPERRLLPGFQRGGRQAEARLLHVPLSVHRVSRSAGWHRSGGSRRSGEP